MTPVRYFSKLGWGVWFLFKKHLKKKKLLCLIAQCDLEFGFVAKLGGRGEHLFSCFFLKGKVFNVGFCVVLDVGVKSLDYAVHKEFLQCLKV